MIQDFPHIRPMDVYSLFVASTDDDLWRAAHRISMKFKSSKSELREKMENRGFAIEEMGGGCKAYVRTFPTSDGYLEIAVTHAEWLGTAPKVMEDPVDVSFTRIVNDDVESERMVTTDLNTFLHDHADTISGWTAFLDRFDK
jgi:hypothetical protein